MKKRKKMKQAREARDREWSWPRLMIFEFQRFSPSTYAHGDAPSIRVTNSSHGYTECLYVRKWRGKNACVNACPGSISHHWFPPPLIRRVPLRNVPTYKLRGNCISSALSYLNLGRCGHIFLVLYCRNIAKWMSRAINAGNTMQSAARS